MKKKLFNNYKLEQIKQIKNNYKNLFFFRVQNLDSKEIIQLKKNLASLNFKCIFLKQNLVNKLFSNLRGQGSLIIVFSNNEVIQENFSTLLKNNKMEFILSQENNKIFNKYKVDKILKNPTPLNIQLKKSAIILFNLLSKIKD